MNSKDSLGDRMKADYESRTRYLLPRRTFTLVRVDGRSFHSYTRDCARPYDEGLMADMDATALALCAELTGARLAFVQSDEIQVLLTDFETPRHRGVLRRQPAKDLLDRGVHRDGAVQSVASPAATLGVESGPAGSPDAVRRKPSRSRSSTRGCGRFPRVSRSTTRSCGGNRTRHATPSRWRRSRSSRTGNWRA